MFANYIYLFYHFILGQFPLGTYHDAKQKSENSHKIPLEKNGGEKIHQLYTDIKKFMEVCVYFWLFLVGLSILFRMNFCKLHHIFRKSGLSA